MGGVHPLPSPIGKTMRGPSCTISQGDVKATYSLVPQEGYQKRKSLKTGENILKLLILILLNYKTNMNVVKLVCQFKTQNKENVLKNSLLVSENSL